MASTVFRGRQTHRLGVNLLTRQGERLAFDSLLGQMSNSQGREGAPRFLVWLGVLVGMAGPFGILRIHDIRDWAQRESHCHDFFAHRRGIWLDAFWQLNCTFRFRHPPKFIIEQEFAGDRWYRVMDVTWPIWLGANDVEPIASAMDQYDHLGQVWIMFFKGEDPALSSRFRERAMQAIKLRWPETTSLPIMPTGSIPLRADLVPTPAGYIVKPSEAYRYQLKDGGKQPQ